MNSKVFPKATILATLIFACTPALAGKDGAAVEAQPEFQSALNSVSITASELIVDALQFIGIHYRYGGKDPQTGFDCSGFVSHVFSEAAGVTLPHNAYRMALMGHTVPSEDLEPGDLVFYKTMRQAFSHVGIYLGDNKFIHAPRTGKSVEISDMNDAYWAKRFQGARRVADLAAVAHTEEEHSEAETRSGGRGDDRALHSMF
jgi:cell wall-associated NlpC family hydrolase